LTKKKSCDFFPHVIKTGKTISVLEELYGNDGYAFWFKLLELLGSSDNFIYDCKIEKEYKFLMLRTKTNNEKCRNILNTLCELEAIDKEKWEKENIVFVENLVKNITKFTKNQKIDEKTNLVNKEDNKISYAEFVKLTDKEYLKLFDKYGEAKVKRMIEILDNYKGQSKKNQNRYDSDYRAILNWVVERVEKEFTTKTPTTSKSKYKDLSFYDM
jgi:hypothetical protein